MGSRSRCLLVAVDNAAAVEIVRTELNRDAVAGEDTDEVFAHASGDVCKGLGLVLKLDLEHRVWQGLYNHRHDFNCIFLRQTISFGKAGDSSPFVSTTLYGGSGPLPNRIVPSAHWRTQHL